MALLVTGHLPGGAELHVSGGVPTTAHQAQFLMWLTLAASAMITLAAAARVLCFRVQLVGQT